MRKKFEVIDYVQRTKSYAGNTQDSGKIIRREKRVDRRAGDTFDRDNAQKMKEKYGIKSKTHATTGRL